MLLIITAFVLSLTSAQTIIPNTLPACAQQCSRLQDAQRLCVPPIAPAASQRTCFCESNFLIPLRSGGAPGLCPTCSAPEMETTYDWFRRLCAAPNTGANAGGDIPDGVQPIGPPTTTSTSTRAARTSTNLPNAAGGGSTISDRPPPDNRDWISTHWRWVVMVIILFFGLGLLAFVCWYLHRRYLRRRDAEGVQTQPDLNTWGPGRSVHDFGAESSRPPMNEKDKGVTAANAGVPEQAFRNNRSSRRLTKGWLSRTAGRGNA